MGKLFSEPDQGKKIPPLPTHVEFPNDGRSKKHRRKEGGGEDQSRKIIGCSVRFERSFPICGPSGVGRRRGKH